LIVKIDCGSLGRFYGAGFSPAISFLEAQMFPRRALPAILLLATAAAALAGPLHRFELDNGLEVLTKESHGGPMVACIVTVGAGARWEDEASFGASHLLEHMAFDGTAARSREDINEGIKEIGGYLNAFTRREYTCYILLVPSEYLSEGLRIQADMLYASTLPAEEFEKEKLVVLEEMRKDMDSGSYEGEKLRRAALLGGTPYEHPVLGSFETIEAQTRESVYDYYRRQYVPANSRVFLVGDFDPEKIGGMMREIFGPYGGDKPAAPKAVELDWPEKPEFDWIHVTEGQTRVSLTWPAPGIESGRYPAQLVMASMLSDAHRSPFAGLDASVDVELYEGFSLVTMEIEVGDRPLPELLADLASRMPALRSWNPPEDLVAEAAHGLRVEDSFLADTYHYFAMMKSAELHLGGFPYLSDYLDRLQSMKSRDVRRALEGSLLGGSPKILVMSQEEAPGSADSELSSPALEVPLSAFAGSAWRPRRLLNPPSGKWARARALLAAGVARKAKGPETLREQLPNGMTLLVKSDPGSEVFAAHLLIEGRSLLEPKGEAGMVDLMQRLLSSGTIRHSGEEIDAKLSSMGARLKVSDNPWIPFDDYYSREDFSFIRLETLDESAEEALDLVAELVGEASFPDSAFERERGKMIGALAMGGTDPGKEARQAAREAIFGGGPRSRAIAGTTASLASIRVEDLRAFRGRYYDPRRMILSVVTGLPAAEAIGSMRRAFGALPAGEGSLPPTALASGPARIARPMDKKQVALRALRILPEASELDASLPALVSILSARMGLELRERKGLAYSVGASLQSLPGLAPQERGFSLLTLAMSTSADKREQARAGMQEQIRRMVEESPSRREIVRAVNGAWGRLLMRNLSRIYQAYSMGLAAYLGEDPFAAPGGNIDRQRKATPRELQDLARKILVADDWIWVLAGGGLE